MQRHLSPKIDLNCCVGDCLSQFSDLTPSSTWGVCGEGNVCRLP
jgi:hypothetical protein